MLRRAPSEASGRLLEGQRNAAIYPHGRRDSDGGTRPGFKFIGPTAGADSEGSDGQWAQYWPTTPELNCKL